MKIINIKGVNEKIYELSFANGFRCFIWKSSLDKENILSLTVKYGSIHTKFSINNKIYEVPNGTAHFLEHIKFNEDENNTAHEYFEKLRSNVNAYTTYDRTVYEVESSCNFKENLFHLLYFVFNPYFSKKQIEKEKPIIIEEARTTLDNPYNDGYKTLIDNLFFYNNKKHLITGAPDEVNTISIDDLKIVHKAFYHPKNMFLTISGNVNIDEVKEVINDFFKQYNFSKYLNPSIINEEEKDEVKKDNVIKTANVAEKRLLLGFKILTKNLSLPRVYLMIYFNLLLDVNFSSTSSFNKLLINKYIKDDLYYFCEVDKEYLFTFFSCSPKDIDDTTKLLQDRFLNMEINKKELLRKIKGQIAYLIISYENNYNVNSDIIFDVNRYDKVIDNYKDIYQSLNIKDAKKVIEILSKSKMSRVILLPKK